MAAKAQAVSIPKMDIRRLEITLISTSQLVSNQWSEKAKQEMLDSQTKKPKGPKKAKDPVQCFMDSLYWMSKKPKKPTMADVKKAKFGFPVIAFKAAAVDACSFIDSITKVLARGAFHIDGDLVEIESGPPTMREDMVRVGKGKADIHYRGEFNPWKVTLPIRYNAEVLSIEQIVNLFNRAGFSIGVGEHRPQRNGYWGMFHVATESEAV